MQNFRALGALPMRLPMRCPCLYRDPHASGGWGLCPQTSSLRQLRASPPDPLNSLPHCEFLATRLDTRIGKASAVIRALHYSVVMKRELSKKAKLSIFKAGFVPIFTYGHESWVMTERVRSQVQASEIKFLRRIEGVTLFNKVRSSEIRKSLNIEPLLLRIERSQH